MVENFNVEIVSPDRSILKTDAQEVSIPCFEGEMGILKDHIPIITFLRPGIIKVINAKEQSFYVEEGTVEFKQNNLLILTSTAKKVTDIDNLESLISEVERKLNNIEISDKEKYLLSYKLETLKKIK